MTDRLLRQTTWFLLLLYLCCGHAAAHGLSWCLDAGQRAHLERDRGFCSDAVSPSGAVATVVCATADCGAICHAGSHSDGGADCRHLPLTAPHRNVFNHGQLLEDGIVAVLPAAAAAVAAWLADLGLVSGARQRAAHLPPPQALTAQRYIVLTC